MTSLTMMGRLLRLLVALGALQGARGVDNHEDMHHRSMIVNGHDAVPGRFPYFVALQHYGGGVLIAPDIVLTAGHCKPSRHFQSDIQIRVGAYDYYKQKDEELFSIVDSARHPHWKELGDDEFQNDFALLKLDRPVANVRPIRLNRRASLPHVEQELTVVGLGDTSQDPDEEIRPSVLQQVSLNAISNEECSLASHRLESYNGRIVDTHLCTTGGPNNLRDACSYDSGGPIVIPGKTYEHDMLVGVVSWGMLCGDPHFPAVNARVSAAIDWIDETVCAMSDAPPPEFCGQLPITGWTWTRFVSIGAGIVILALALQRWKGHTSTRKRGYLSDEGKEDLTQSLHSSDDGYGSCDGIEVEPVHHMDSGISSDGANGGV